LATRPYYFYIFCLVFKNNLFSSSVYAYFISENGKTECFLEKESLEKAGNYILEKVKKNRNYINKLEKYALQTATDLNNFCENVKKINLKKLSINKLINLYKRSTNVYIKHTSLVVVIRNVNRQLIKELEKFVISRVKNKDNEKILADLFLTSQRSFTAKAEIKLLEVVLKIKKVKNNIIIKKLIKNYYNKYLWLNIGYSDMKPLSNKELRNKINKLIKKDNFEIKKELKQLKDQPKIFKKKIQKAIKNIKPTLQIKRAIEFAGLCTYYKDYIRGNLNHLHYTNQFIFREIGRRLKIKWQETAMLLPAEMIKILKKKKIPSLNKRKNLVIYSDKKKINLITGKQAKDYIKILKKKKIPGLNKRKNLVIYSDKKKINLITGKQAKDYINNIKKDIDVNISEIKGIVACPGKVKGRVLIIKNQNDYSIQKVKKDFILTTPMTTPDIIFLMKKSKAIITDEGGLTSHAAIVSRELNIPCIIGTKIATKVLKDGDLVEVDADKGIIRIIK